VIWIAVRFPGAGLSAWICRRYARFGCRPGDGYAKNGSLAESQPASRFFLFPNAGATLGMGAAALHKAVPIEEYVFYLSGFMAVL
jgi:hypothetical protein